MKKPTHRERILAVLAGELLDEIPSYGEVPMDVTVFGDLMAKPTGDMAADLIAQARFFDNSAIELLYLPLRKTLSKDKTHHTYEYETGAVWHEQFEPTFCREATKFPLNDPADVAAYRMPDALAPGRVDDDAMRAVVARLHEEGYFVEGTVMGVWQAIYYYLTSFENILEWMAVEPEAAHTIFDMTSKFSLDCARRVMGWGVDCVFTPSDLGSGQGLLFSEGMFEEYVFPWLKAISDLAHENGKILHLHSHGHIEDLMDGIVRAGVDMVNPVGPSDHNDLAMFKRRWGSQITLMGGISTTIDSMTREEIAAHVEQVISIGRVGGRFIPRTESGIPPMPREHARFYVETLHEQRRRGYCPAP